ncbi:hypothetical protein GPECTOR_56g393 [Gonium pectorale]|uniref:Uncharacterized protein n=1 Tax=Gonium pectorale TaxID=33097 RepID=A0A150G626_GONPE|nr:hypothetical protein GPECTOR_56g393 [Gonium pectorale]|eukprot:KXZ45297.1 hypothetical protein GPECTOR_56g393 [Gonium pectorale]
MDFAVPNPDAMLSSGTSLPEILIPGILDCLLPRNGLACSLRVVNKATAAILGTPEFMTVRLSEPVPHHAFAWRWGRPGAMRDMTRAQRRELLCLTAASGATDNLALAARAVACPLTAEVGYAAGKAGQLGSCAMLAELGYDMGRAVEGAAAGGHLALCEELLSRWAGVRHDLFICAVAAAKAGHVHVAEWMMRRDEGMRPSSQAVWKIGEGVAERCDLATLQRFLAKWTRQRRAAQGWVEQSQLCVLAAAAGSHTPDWRAKVEWLESQGFPQTWRAFAAAAKRPDALERFAWLAQRGYPRPDGGKLVVSLRGVARGGNAAAVLCLAEDWPASPDFTDVAGAAAVSGHLHVLQALHSAGRRFDAHGASSGAARNGHLHVLAWLVEEALGLDAVPLHEELFEAAAGSGRVELLAWLRERGCPWGVRTFTADVESGCEAALEWLVERGYPMPEDGSPYEVAAQAVDVATLEGLRRLGCPWGPARRLLDSGVAGGVPVMSWLVASGCPLHWRGGLVQAIEAEAHRRVQEASEGMDWGRWARRREESVRVLAWLRAEAAARRP